MSLAWQMNCRTRVEPDTVFGLALGLGRKCTEIPENRRNVVGQVSNLSVSRGSRVKTAKKTDRLENLSHLRRSLQV
jgi:hypothetical protein